MVIVYSKMCGHPDCPKHPAYGVEGSKTAEFCAGHRKEGMVNVVSQRCSHPGCNKQPAFGLEGSKKKEFCAEHKKEGLVIVGRKRCSHSGCDKQPSYGVQGTKAAEFCAQHKQEGMVDVYSKRCAHLGCNKYPKFGLEGGKKKFCAPHARERMLDQRPTGRLLDGLDSSCAYDVDAVGASGTRLAVGLVRAGRKRKEIASTTSEWIMPSSERAITAAAAVKVEGDAGASAFPGAAEAVRYVVLCLSF